MADPNDTQRVRAHRARMAKTARKTSPYATWRSEGIEWPVRIARLTGKAELLSRVGWLPMEPAPAKP